MNASLTGEALVGALVEVARGRLLDLGCGSAPLRGVYEPLVASFVCADWPSSTHTMAQLDAALDASSALPFRSASFQTVLLSDVIEHVADPRSCLAEISRVLAPSGHLVLSTPFLYPVHEAPRDYQRLTSFGLRLAIESVGLQVVRLTAIGGSAEVMADLVTKHVSQVPRVGPPLARWLGRGAVRAARSRAGVRAYRATSDVVALGHLVVAQRPGAGRSERLRSGELFPPS